MNSKWTCGLNSCLCEWRHTKTCFETQAKEDSEMAYLNHGFGVNSIEWDITKDSPRDIFNDKYDVISN